MPTNYELGFAQRPAVYAAWRALITTVREHMDDRRFELVTLAAARRLRSSYCSLAHGKILRDEHGEDVVGIVRERAGLDATDAALIDFAEHIVDDATSIGDDDRERLRALGLTDLEIMDVVLAVTARCFFSKTLDALGVLPDAQYAELEPELLEVLVVGRPIANT